MLGSQKGVSVRPWEHDGGPENMRDEPYVMFQAPVAKNVPSSNESPAYNVTWGRTCTHDEVLTSCERDVRKLTSKDCVMDRRVEEHSIGAGGMA